MRWGPVVVVAALAAAGCIGRPNAPGRPPAGPCASFLPPSHPGCYHPGPPARMDARFWAPIDSQATVSPRQVDDVIRRHLEAIRCCYDGQLLRDPRLEGKGILDWMVEPSGEVSSSWTFATTPGVQPVVDCVGEEICGWQFPPAAHATPVVHSFVFKD